MTVLLDEEWFRKFCTERVNKISLMIYARTMCTVSPTRMNLFYDRLFNSAMGAKTDKETEDRFYAMEERILREHSFFTHRMWKYCGAAVMRLCYQISGGSKVKVREFLVLRRRLFRLVRRARDDADVNARVEAFYLKIRQEYAAAKH